MSCGSTLLSPSSVGQVPKCVGRRTRPATHIHFNIKGRCRTPREVRGGGTGCGDRTSISLDRITCVRYTAAGGRGPQCEAEGSFRFVSFRFVSFRFVSFRSRSVHVSIFGTVFGTVRYLVHKFGGQSFTRTAFYVFLYTLYRSGFWLA